ncbi:hypothetical protein ASD77_04425 [Pseudoxanthomonas sp. Root65]|uniref:hypothetical protein n=1 Tax=Pseudoxanthomonas sp. Root65 TaxID=1736576 RepID=UPI0006F1E250|nr:hypothetical protein [Pseudoxanthomonas sp. Root65]KRA53891.1 hypothetical protein ASD77_04425 [Pseudoxanthomonas sp. Root65]
MTFSSEWLLVAGILAFYVQDSVRLAYFDDVVVSGGRTWRVAIEAVIEMRGRFLWLPHPLLPARTILHASWLASAENAATDTADDLRAFARLLLPIRVGCVLVGAIVLIALPYLLLSSAPPTWLLACLAAWLAVTLAMLSCLAARRGPLGLTHRQLALLAIECLLCPPFAVNLYRKLCDLRGFRGDPIAFAASTLTTRQRQMLLEAIERRMALFAQSTDDEVLLRLQQAGARIRLTLESTAATAVPSSMQR